MSEMEYFQDEIEDRLLHLEAKFDGLKDFVFNKLKECVATTEELRTNFKKRSADSIRSDTSDSSFASTSFAESTPAKKTKVSPVQISQPDDIQDEKVKQGILKYMKEENNPSEKLTPLQLVFVQYYMMDLRAGYSARRDVITKMIDKGIASGIWPKGFVPEGIKNSFHSYLRDKAKNMQKKRLLQKSMDDFAGEFDINPNRQSDV